MDRPKKKKTLIWLALLGLGAIIQVNLIFSHSAPVFSATSLIQSISGEAQPSTVQPGTKQANERSKATETEAQKNVKLTALTAVESVLPLGKMVAKVPAPTKTAYLTFDDGPNQHTKEIVYILDKNGIRGSFFWIGENVKDEYVPIARQMIEEGHVIGTHTMHHTAMKHKPLSEQESIIKETTVFISKKIGAPIVYFRPPYGSVDKNTSIAAMENKQTLIYWETDSEDWKYPHNPQKILSNIAREIKPGGIILMHEKPQTVALLPQIIQNLKKEGYTLAPLPEPRLVEPGKQDQLTQPVQQQAEPAKTKS
ncbi:polysaccharide deacetylase family protein [Aneurinibacillus sp. Ricciae_BoGa-3]|uniref:polysaccharide deacetylase family protein n=1 Tax=Aneurinibacillus sp. Ricciae_BoGa-3 TaxID=3022697 RepID=UPI002342178D|nr:polysaccharide deacetylase family protein [Aneurinibacillus sp. Ricciae_BoGa-3]WCK55888.1 polysaccharide deacetylase family protein [Aneurinibacillus sp. Ricciae_BoGa-3]